MNYKTGLGDDASIGERPNYVLDWTRIDAGAYNMPELTVTPLAEPASTTGKTVVILAAVAAAVYFLFIK